MQGTGHFQVKRLGNAVVMVLGCKDEYAAMMLFDTIEKELTDGLLTLKMATEGYQPRGDE